MKTPFSESGDGPGPAEGMPHIYRVGPEFLPHGLVDCACCGEQRRHHGIVAWDDDLTGFLCRECITPLAAAEYFLISAPGIRRPELSDLMSIEDN